MPTTRHPILARSGEVAAIDALPPAVLDHAIGPVRVGDDLESLRAVAVVGAIEATIFYAGRLLELLTGAALARVGADGGNVWSNLLRLDDWGLVSEPRITLFHALRRAGNEVRHVTQGASEHDAVLALVVLDRLLVWYFADCPLGPRGPAEGLSFAGAVPVGEALAPLERHPWQLDGLRAASVAHADALLDAPTVLALYGEALVALGTDGVAHAVGLLDAGLGRHPGNLRLRQLRAWTRRLQGDDAAALAELTSLDEAHPDDPETLTFLASTHKRLSLAATRRADRNRHAQLAATGYERVWRRSKGTHVWAGINAASTALLVGDAPRAARIAGEITAQYTRRHEAASASLLPYRGYWDRVTHAEALLLSGDRDAARELFRSALLMYAGHPTWLASTRDQLAWVLPALGETRGVDDYLEARPVSVEARPPMYEPKPLSIDGAELPEELVELGERLAEHVHDVWARERLAQGWTWGPERDDAARRHPSLVPYADLPESEKHLDRVMAGDLLKAIVSLGFRIRPP